MPASALPTPAPSAAGRARASRRFGRGTSQAPDAARWAHAPRVQARRRPRHLVGTRAGESAAAVVAPTRRPLPVDGPRIEMVTMADPERLTVHEQFVADGLIAELEAQARRAQRSGVDRPSGLESAERYPSLPQWLALRGSTLALHPLHRPSSSDRLAHGFAFEDLLAPRLHGVSAAEALRELLGAERAGLLLDRHRAFCDAPMTDEARLLMAGAVDARAIRERATIAADSAGSRRERWSGEARVAAVGAGAGDAAAQLCAVVGAASLTLFDRDPLALAAARVVAGERVPDVRATLAARGAAAEIVAGDRFDVVDLTGALDALPDAAVVALLRAARAALRPGGVVVAAAMLERRPQQTFFDHVLRWPSVIQRSPARLAQLCANAGFGAEQVSLAIGATAPVYAIATIDSAA